MREEDEWEKLLTCIGTLPKDAEVTLDRGLNAVVIQYRIPSYQLLLSHPPQPVPDQAIRVVLKIDEVLKLQTGEVIVHPAHIEYRYGG